MIFMSLLKLAKGAAKDLIDPVILLSALLFGYLSYMMADALTFPMALFLEEYMASYSIGRAFWAAIFSMDVISWLALVAQFIIGVYLASLIVLRVYYREKGEKVNVFVEAWKKWVHAFLGLILLLSVPFVLFFVSFSNSSLWWINILSLLWVGVWLPVLSALVVYKGRGRDRVYEGLLAGRVTWWKIIVILIVFGLFFGVLTLYLPFIGWVWETLMGAVLYIVSARSLLLFEGE